MSSRQNSVAAKIVDEALLLPRRAAADLMAAHGVNFRTVVRVLDQTARRRALAPPPPKSCLPS